MGLEYSGGTVGKYLVDASSALNMIADMNTHLQTVGWTSVALGGGTYRWTSATTPDGLSFAVEATTGTVLGNDVMILNVMTADQAVKSSDYGEPSAFWGFANVFANTATNSELIANKYGFWLYRPGTLAGNQIGTYGVANAFYCGVPFLPDPNKPLNVNGATNASPIQITTIEDHGLTTGDTVFIDGVLGNTGANGTFIVTVTAAKTFTLDGSTGTGAYTSGGRVGTATRISRCIYAGSNGYWAGNGQWRGNPNGNTDGTIFQLINQNGFKSAGAENRLLTVSTYPWRGTRYAITEPWVMAPNSSGGSQFIQFQPYNAALISGTPQVSVDTTCTFDSKNWYIFGSNSTVALAVAYS